jgi:hypothetical protein
MSEESRPGSKAPGLIQNYVSYIGVVIMFTALVCIILLFVIDLTQQAENPYFGVVTYVLLPGVLIIGILVVAVGMVRERRRRRLSPDTELSAYPKIDFNDARQRRIAAVLLIGSFLFVSMSAFGSYKAYHYTESVEFCGQTCHTVMRPNLLRFRSRRMRGRGASIVTLVPARRPTHAQSSPARVNSSPSFAAVSRGRFRHRSTTCVRRIKRAVTVIGPKSFTAQNSRRSITTPTTNKTRCVRFGCDKRRRRQSENGAGIRHSLAHEFR